MRTRPGSTAYWTKMSSRYHTTRSCWALGAGDDVYFRCQHNSWPAAVARSRTARTHTFFCVRSYSLARLRPQSAHRPRPMRACRPSTRPTPARARSLRRAARPRTCFSASARRAVHGCCFWGTTNETPSSVSKATHSTNCRSRNGTGERHCGGPRGKAAFASWKASLRWSESWEFEHPAMRREGLSRFLAFLSGLGSNSHDGVA